MKANCLTTDLEYWTTLGFSLLILKTRIFIYLKTTATVPFRVKGLTLLRSLDAEYAWKEEEAIMSENGYLKLSLREWAKIVNGTYNRDSNNEPYLDAASDMEIHLGQIDLS